MKRERSIRNVFRHMGMDKGFLIQTIYLIFYLFERVSVFYVVRALAAVKYHKGVRNGTIDPNKRSDRPFVMRYIFPEIWVVLNITYAIVFGNLVRGYDGFATWGLWILFAYSFMRVFEMFIYQINVTFFHRLNEVYLYAPKEEDKVAPEAYELKSATRTVIMMIMNMAEYILHFSLMYAVVARMGLCDISLSDSFDIFMSLGASGSVNAPFILNLVYYETIVGEFMNLICLGRFIGMLPAVNTIDKS